MSPFWWKGHFFSQIYQWIYSTYPMRSSEHLSPFRSSNPPSPCLRIALVRFTVWLTKVFLMCGRVIGSRDWSNTWLKWPYALCGVENSSYQKSVCWCFRADRYYCILHFKISKSDHLGAVLGRFTFLFLFFNSIFKLSFLISKAIFWITSQNKGKFICFKKQEGYTSLSNSTFSLL